MIFAIASIVHANNEGNDVALKDDVFAAFNAEKRCIDKVEMVEYTEYDDELTCQHSYFEQCHRTYVTVYKPAQTEECEENFVKNCYIEYKQAAVQENVEVYMQQQECVGEGPPAPRTFHTTVCETRYEIHNVRDDVVNCTTEFETDCNQVTQGYTTTTHCKRWPKVKCDLKTVPKGKWSPITECRNIPKTIMVPGGCSLQPGQTVCHDEIQTVVNPVSSILYITFTNHIWMTI